MHNAEHHADISHIWQILSNASRCLARGRSPRATLGQRNPIHRAWAVQTDGPHPQRGRRGVNSLL